MYAPYVVSDAEWAEAFRAEEKCANGERDALAARPRPDEYGSAVAS